MPLQRIKQAMLTVAVLLVFTGSSPVSAVASASPASAQPSDPTHPRVMQQAAAEVATAKVGPLKPFVPLAPRPAVGGAGGPQREIFGFALASSLSDPTVGYQTWQFSLLTTVAFFGLHVNDDGTFASDSGMSVWNSSQLAAMLAAAHAYGSKVVLTIILQDFGSGTPHMCSGLAHTATTIANTVNEVRAKGVDGVNVDYEGLNGGCGNADPSWARHTFTRFISSLRTAMGGGSLLSVDTYASSAADPYGFFDIGATAPSVDAFFVMAYDLEYSNYARAPTNCSGFCLGPTAPLTGYYYNDTSTASQYLSVVAASKVILGVPYYGRKSCVANWSPNQYPTSPVIADSYLNASGEAGSPMVKAGSYWAGRDGNDPTGQERWDRWTNTTMNCTRELYWDDTTSLAQKYALINRDGLRGVGIWNLNYGGSAPELWSALSTYFACTVTVNLPASQASTQFSASLTANGCSVAYYDVQQFDPAVNPGGVPMTPAVPSGATATATFAGFAGHTYQIWARAHSASGIVSPWSNASTTVAANATLSHAYAGLYILDAYGGVNPESSPPLNISAYWAGWKIARSTRALPGPGSVPQSGAVLDGFGGLHSYGAPITLATSAYWPGWDIARDFAFLPDGSGGYVLDAYGGLHPFSVNGKPMPPAASTSSYWANRDIARRVVIFSDGTGGYVLDGFGGVHPFGIGHPQTGVTLSGYWANWDIIHDIVLIPGVHSGYVLDGYGNTHPFAPTGTAMPPTLPASAYWGGWDIARSVWLLPGSTFSAPGGYVLDGYGGLHPFGNAPAAPSGPYWGRDIARNLTGY